MQPIYIGQQLLKVSTVLTQVATSVPLAYCVKRLVSTEKVPIFMIPKSLNPHHGAGFEVSAIETISYDIPSLGPIVGSLRISIMALELFLSLLSA